MVRSFIERGSLWRAAIRAMLALALIPVLPGAGRAEAIKVGFVRTPPAAQLEPAIGYNDREARLDVKDVLHQIAWYKAQGLSKRDVDTDLLIDKRYVIPLP